VSLTSYQAWVLAVVVQTETTNREPGIFQRPGAIPEAPADRMSAPEKSAPDCGWRELSYLSHPGVDDRFRTLLRSCARLIAAAEEQRSGH
jgi:hypothetical protein